MNIIDTLYQQLNKGKAFFSFLKDWTTAVVIIFIILMSVFNVLFVSAIERLGRYKTGDLLNSSLEYKPNFVGENFPHSIAAAAYAMNPIDIGFVGENEEVSFIIIDKASLLNTNNPLSNIIPTREGLVIYKVQKGDNLSRIAANFGISINTILWANNNLKPNSLQPGQELIVLPVTGVLYRVQSGETLEDISNKYNISEQRIFNANPNLIPAKLEVGSSIIIPDASPVNASRYSSVSKLPKLDGYFAIPTTGWNWGKLHNYNAVDIANACGTPIYAAAEGLVKEVLNSGWNHGYGKYIVIEHPNGAETKYAHNSKNFVSVGDYVLKGDRISAIGNTGLTHGPTGCHLHFEVRGAENPFTK
ncbi:LysM peptidoglycan-binding domain-containing protein [Candidatus Wolfebacteria bacterium]|nr:LysM peptidoglycan-binding domain-containing protein [Candidatus Wolfebacteria bacterium]